MTSTLLALALLIGGCALRPSAPKTVPLLQGLTGETSAEFSALLPAGSLPHFTVVTPTGETLLPTRAEKVISPDGNWAVHKLLFDKLSGSASHQLVVHDGQALRDRRSFRLFPNQAGPVRFAAVRCGGPCAPDDEDDWEATLGKKPEWLFLLGDDPGTSSPHETWRRYVAGRSHAGLFHREQLVPVYATWNGGHAESAEVFRTFYAQSFPSDVHDAGPGLSGRLKLRGTHLAFLDPRSSLTPQASRYGEAQEIWLLGGMKEFQLPTWLVDSGRFFGESSDSYETTDPDAFQRLLGRLRENATPFVFLSAGEGHGEIMQFPRSLLGQLSYEFSTGPFRKGSLSGKELPPNPWRVVGRGDVPHFFLVDATLGTSQWDLVVEALHGKETLFRRELSLTTEALKDFTIEKRQKRRRYRRARWRR